jgi:hypothetical protein
MTLEHKQYLKALEERIFQLIERFEDVTEQKVTRVEFGRTWHNKYLKDVKIYLEQK